MSQLFPHQYLQIKYLLHQVQSHTNQHRLPGRKKLNYLQFHQKLLRVMNYQVQFRLLRRYYRWVRIIHYEDY